MVIRAVPAMQPNFLFKMYESHYLILSENSEISKGNEGQVIETQHSRVSLVYKIGKGN